MKYTFNVDIALPRTRVVELFNNPDHWKDWQESFISSQPLKGTPGEIGAKTKIMHKFGRREIEMVETIESKNLPEQMTCTYEAPGAWNRVANRFVELGSDKTRWEFESEFKCTGLLRIMAFLMPNMFCKASLKDMHNFKRFAESQETNVS